MHIRFLYSLRASILPLFLAVALLLIEFVQSKLGAIDFIDELFSQSVKINVYWVAIILLVSFLETIFVAGFYIPGTLVLVFLAITTQSNIELIVFSVVAYCGFCFGILANYTLGYFSRDVVQKLGHKYILFWVKEKFDKFGDIILIVFCLHPNYVGTLFLFFGLVGKRAQRQFVIAILCLPISIGFWILVIKQVKKLDFVTSYTYSHTYILICLLGLVSIFLFLKAWLTFNKNPN